MLDIATTEKIAPEITTIEKIKSVTGLQVTECSCHACKEQCQRAPCVGTPEDMLKLILAGYADRLAVTVWAAGMVIGVTERPVEIIAPFYDERKGACTFFTNGLCELHEKGLKPTEGKLSHHGMRPETNMGENNLAWIVVKEWINLNPGELKKELQRIYLESL